MRRLLSRGGNRFPILSRLPGKVGCLVSDALTRVGYLPAGLEEPPYLRNGWYDNRWDGGQGGTDSFR